MSMNVSKRSASSASVCRFSDTGVPPAADVELAEVSCRTPGDRPGEAVSAATAPHSMPSSVRAAPGGVIRGVKPGVGREDGLDG